MFPCIFFIRFRIDEDFCGTAVVSAYREQQARQMLIDELIECGYEEPHMIVLYEIDTETEAVQFVDYKL